VGVRKLAVAQQGCARGQVLHGCTTTTEAVRRAIQNSQESLRALAKRYGINQKTVAKWRQRETVADLPTGPKEAKSTVLSIEEEAIIVAFRRHTLLPLDDCLYALQPNIPHLTRSSLHRCLHVFDAGAFQKNNVLDIDPADFERCWRIGRLGGLLVGQAAARRMAKRGHGTIIFTGATAALLGSAGFANLASRSEVRRAGTRGEHGS
jgi:NAD(P)-dependent dehydrogenase (short-subunit alcohol dehydrogenase family)